MVHKGFYEKYFIDPFIRQYSDFKGTTARRDALCSLLAWIILTAGITGILTGLVGLLGGEVAFPCLWIIGGIWILASLVPLAALAVRASRGRTEPLTEPENASRTGYSILGIDILLSVVCFLFLILGIPMMITTVRSETIEIDPSGISRLPASKLPEDSVYEEPIFNYQQTDISDEPLDTVASIEEAFDSIGNLAEPVVEETPQEHPDSLAF